MFTSLAVKQMGRAVRGNVHVYIHVCMLHCKGRAVYLYHCLCEIDAEACALVLC